MCSRLLIVCGAVFLATSSSLHKIWSENCEVALCQSKSESWWENLIVFKLTTVTTKENIRFL